MLEIESAYKYMYAYTDICTICVCISTHTYKHVFMLDTKMSASDVKCCHIYRCDHVFLKMREYCRI